MSAIVDDIFALWQERAHLQHGPSLSTVTHMLQCALCAERDGAPDTLVIAALLHDIGHLLHPQPGERAERGVDGPHEEVGARWLEADFLPEVTEPTRLHVAAKHYLCAVEPEYHRLLSPASGRSLARHGGPFTIPEVAAFEARPHWRDAVQLRRYDDRSRVAGSATPDLGYFRARLLANLRRDP